MPRRGGRGGFGRRKTSSGGHGSNYGRINGKKKKSKGTSNNHRSSNRNNEYPELMDLNENLHVPAENSMKNLSKRPGRLMQEALYTEKHQSETMGKNLRSRPIEFVKAVEVYDPSAKLFEKKESKARFEKPSEVETEVTELNLTIELTDNANSTVISEDHSPKASPKTEISPKNQELLNILNSPDKRKVSAPDSPILTFSSGSESESESEEQHEKDEEDHNEISVRNLDINEASDFMIDTEKDVRIESEYQVNKPKTHTLMNRARACDDESDEESDTPNTPKIIPKLDYEDTLTIGKVSLRTSKDAQGVVTTELPSRKDKRSKQQVQEQLDFLDESDLSDNKISGYNEYIASIMRDMQSDDEDDGYISSTNFDIMASSSSEEEEEEVNNDDDNAAGTDIEYGFLPDDYEFDVSQVTVTNVRFGIQNQYYTKNVELTGSPDNFMWIDEQDFIDFVLSKGVKEHRLPSFLKYITNGMVDRKYEEPEYSDVYISESEEEDDEIGRESDSDLGDDIDDLIEFTKKTQQNYIGIEYINPTRSLATKGKGRKKQLDLMDRTDLDNEIRESLQEQYLNHKQRRKDLKQAKKDSKYEAGIKSNDLWIKYPYSIHIKEIKSEFELFLHDGSKDSLSFPPLDRHGNKVVSKMASCYNFKSQTCGNNGLKQFVKASKTRKTFHYLPRYNEVTHLTKQRPIFNRTDQKRPKDEIRSTDGKTKDKSKKSGGTVIKEGEAVGAKAPEIGKDNIGRLLLEKLGWSSGEGLGALGNKGISEPLLATMKKSKTGLKQTHY